MIVDRADGARFVPQALADGLATPSDGPRVLAGIGAGGAAFLAPLLPALLSRPVALIVRNRREAETTVHDATFHAARAGGSRRRPLLLPALEPEPYVGVPPHLQVVVERAVAHALAASGDVDLLVIPAEALLLRLPSPALFAELSHNVAVGQELDRDQLVAALFRAGYRRQDMVGSIGEIAVRGGIIDVFSPSSHEPLRIELLGDTIDSIRAFDPVSQRSLEPLQAASLLPVQLFALGADAERRLRDWGERLPESAKDDLRKKREELREKGSFPGFEFMAPVFLDEMVDATAYLTRFAVVVLEAEGVAAELASARAQLEEVYREVCERGMAVPTPDELALTPRELTARLSTADVHLQSLDAPRALSLSMQPGRHYGGRIKELVKDVASDRDGGLDSFVVVPSEAEARRVEAMLSEYQIGYVEGDAVPALWRDDAAVPQLGGGRIAVTTGRLMQGFRSPDLKLAVYAAPEVFGTALPPARRRRRGGSAFASDFRDLKVGDSVVHVEHGVARFLGLRTVEVEDVTQEFMVLGYAEDGKLYVPLDRLDLVQKFSGVEGLAPRVDSLGGTAWQRVKRKVKADLRDMAKELLQLYAARRVVQGHAFAPDGMFQKEFEDAFPFTETPDQLTAIADLKRDLESPRSMDRLLCGDVGYGKTEVAMRAAFKVVAEGKQVAVLAPTTVLALQHFHTFSERFRPFPVKVDMVSRFRSKKEIEATLAEVASGRVDVLIGTHRLLSKDVTFRDLGLLVVDEEQRFGVRHKETLKQLRKGVDALTLTATPIPRTLQMSLAGMRDMSVIETPPKDRLAIETTVLRFDPEVVKEGIKREMERGGQVFFVHNRVESIYAMADAVRRIAPFARVLVGHGQMTEKELEEVMVRFIERDADLLLATTIIENGLDIPNANTIFINRAHRLGLSQLYQLRGRVGRSDRPAYAYLLVPGKVELSAVARRRLHAIQEFTELGSGFRIAALDLEIRGAGNLLGRQQHGHINAVGFDLFMDLLEQAVREIKGEVGEDVNTQISLGLDVAVPQDYVSDANQRLMVYKRCAGARALVEVDDLERETADRFGPIPSGVKNLFEAQRLKLDAQRARLVAVEREGKRGRLRFGPEARLDPAALVDFVRADKSRKLHPDGRLDFSVTPGADAIEEIRIVIAELSTNLAS